MGFNNHWNISYIKRVWGNMKYENSFISISNNINLNIGIQQHPSIGIIFNETRNKSNINHRIYNNSIRCNNLYSLQQKSFEKVYLK